MIAIVIFGVGPRYKLLDRARVSFLLPDCSEAASEITECPRFRNPRNQQLVASVVSDANILDRGLGIAALDGENFHRVRADNNSLLVCFEGRSNNAEFRLLSFRHVDFAIEVVPVKIGLSFVADEVSTVMNPIRSLDGGGNGPVAAGPIGEKQRHDGAPETGQKN